MFCVPTYFYTDCVITDLKQIDLHSNEFTARINGRTAKRLAMTHDLYHHLMGADRSAKSRVWFYAPGFNKALVIAAVRPAGQEHSVLRNRAIRSPYKMLFRTLLAGLLAWFATWALLAIPVLPGTGPMRPKVCLCSKRSAFRSGLVLRPCT